MNAVKWFVVLVAFNVIDAVATWYVLTNGIAFEYNPIVRVAFEYHPLSIFLIKTVLLVAIAYLLAESANKSHKLLWPTIVYGLISAYQVAFFIWN
jgi:hypothetical protein